MPVRLFIWLFSFFFFSVALLVPFTFIITLTNDEFIMPCSFPASGSQFVLHVHAISTRNSRSDFIKLWRQIRKQICFRCEGEGEGLSNFHLFYTALLVMGKKSHWISKYTKHFLRDNSKEFLIDLGYKLSDPTASSVALINYNYPWCWIPVYPVCPRCCHGPWPSRQIRYRVSLLGWRMPKLPQTNDLVATACYVACGADLSLRIHFQHPISSANGKDHPPCGHLHGDSQSDLECCCSALWTVSLLFPKSWKCQLGECKPVIHPPPQPPLT